MPYGTVNADSLVSSDGGVISPNINSLRNRIINGAMMIDQRNAGASVTGASGGLYTLDRWDVYSAQASKLTVQQNAGSVTPPAGFKNYLGITSSSAYSVGTSESFSVRQKIEGFNTSDLGFGAAGASTVTLSFWVRSSLTGSFGGCFYNGAGDRFYPFTYTISSANTWEQKTVTVAGDTSGTWVGATNGVGLTVQFSLGAGATVSGTAGAWTGSTALQPTGSTSVVGTNGATFYITGVQLEKGSVATSFDYRPYGTEYQLCQRYYSQGSVVPTYNGTAFSVTMPAFNFYGQPMRISPTVTVANGAVGYGFVQGFVVVSSAPISAGAYYLPGAFTATAEL